MPKALIREAGPLQAEQVEGAKSGLLKICIATPGWGSSGYYSAKVLENAATNRVFPAGTQSFLDHETETEKYDRPERSVRDLAAVAVEDAVWESDSQKLTQVVQVFGAHHELLTDEQFAKTVGMSMRAYADSTVGEAEGRKGRIITELIEALSVDVVTRAGRGGHIIEILESARPTEVAERAVAHGVAEATANDIRAALDTALREEYGGEKRWVWVRDFDEKTVWFSLETPDGSGIYAQAYELDDDGAALLDGEPTEVRARTEYVPVKASESGPPSVPVTPAGQPPTPKSPEEDTMGNIQVDEAEHGRLTEAAGRVPTLESERDTAIRERDEARRAMRDRDNTDAANTVIDTQAKEAGVTFTALERRGLVAAIPVTEAGEIDKAAFEEAVKTAAAEKAEEAGAGSIRGFGRDTTTVGEAKDPWADIDTHLNIGQEG